MSHNMIGIWAIWMGAWAVILNKANIDLGWLFYVQGIFLSPAVIPIALTVTWRKLTKAAVLWGSLVGTIFAMLGWFIGCWKIYGSINITNLALPYNAVTGGLSGYLFSGILTIGISLWKPDNYDFAGTRAIAEVDDGETNVEREGTDLQEIESASDDKKENEKDVSSSSSAVEEAKRVYGTTEEERMVLQKVFKRAVVYSLLFTGCVAIVLPLPMFFSHYIFSKKFYAFWVACTIIWVLLAGAFCIILPIWESRAEIWVIVSGCLGYLANGKRSKQEKVGSQMSDV